MGNNGDGSFYFEVRRGDLDNFQKVLYEKWETISETEQQQKFEQNGKIILIKQKRS